MKKVDFANMSDNELGSRMYITSFFWSEDDVNRGKKIFFKKSKKWSSQWSLQFKQL